VLQHPRVIALTKPIQKPPESHDAAKLPQAGKGSGDDASEQVEGARGAQDNSRLRRRRRGAQSVTMFATDERLIISSDMSAVTHYIRRELTSNALCRILPHSHSIRAASVPPTVRQVLLPLLCLTRKSRVKQITLLAKLIPISRSFPFHAHTRRCARKCARTCVRACTC
jgi:hypothetical protein